MKRLFILFFAFAVAVTHAQTINISTGVATWKVTPTGGSAIAIASPHSIWASQQPTPVTGTNAKWVSPTGSVNVTKGVYVFETIIPVASGIKQLNLNFQVSADDILHSLEIITPTGTLPLGVPPYDVTYAYRLRKAIDTIIKCPVKGEYRLRAKVEFLDAMGGFLLSGNATQTPGVCCDCPIPNTNVTFSICTVLGGGTVATASAIGASTSLGNGWTLKQVACAGPNPCKWMPGSIKWQATGSSITIPSGVLTPGCYVLTHYVNRCSKNWDPKQCVSYRSICFTICDNAIKAAPDVNPQAMRKMQVDTEQSEEEKEAELIREGNNN